VAVFRIPDIHCDSCVRSLTGAAHDVDAQATLQADLQTKIVTVKTAAPDADIAAAFRDAGFTVEST
jgi:copper chaperone